MATSMDQNAAAPLTRAPAIPNALTLRGLKDDFARMFMRRGVLGWGNGAWPGGEASGLRERIARLVPGDQVRAHEMYANRFGRSAPDRLGQFGWLKHFAASGKALHALYAIELIRGWAVTDRPGLTGGQAAASLLALTVDAFDFARKGPKPFAADYLRINTLLCHSVYGWQPSLPEEKLTRAIALAHAMTAFTGLEALRPRLRDVFDQVLPQVVLADGGHCDGTPESLLKLLLQLLPLRTAMRNAHEPLPASLNGAIERMLPMLRMLQHKDGAIAHLRGSAPHAEVAAIILAQDDSYGAPLSLARHSGFARLEAGGSLIIADTTPVTGFTLDISIAGQPVMECAHAGMPQFKKFSTESPAELLELEEGLLLLASVRLRGASQSRHVFTTPSGTDIRVEDSADSMDRPFTLAFTLKEGVSCKCHAEGKSAGLRLPDGQVWRLAVRGGLMQMNSEETELWVTATPDNGQCAITWALQKQ